MNKPILCLLLTLSTVGAAFAQVQPAKQTPESSELWEPVPPVVTPGIASPSASGLTAPSDAVVLFDGKNLDNWVSGKDGGAAKWTLADNCMTVAKGTGDIKTKQEFDSYQLHIEFRTPAVVDGTGQGRGNSGIFMQDRYELQVLDNYQNPTYVNGQIGSIYKQIVPMANPCRKPGEWQTYDVVYQAPRFAKSGLMAEPGYITVLLNGVLVQNHAAIRGGTPYVGVGEIKAHGKGAIRLQDHSNPTSFRNIWIREL